MPTHDDRPPHRPTPATVPLPRPVLARTVDARGGATDAAVVVRQEASVNPTYSVVHVWRSIDDGRLHRSCVRGCMTFATIERAYAYIMRYREHYTPGVRRDYYEVVENAFTGAAARRMMGMCECAVYDALEAVA